MEAEHQPVEKSLTSFQKWNQMILQHGHRSVFVVHEDNAGYVESNDDDNIEGENFVP